MTRQVSTRFEDCEPIQRCGWPECRAACCVYGTWVDEGEVEDILGHVDLVKPHLPSQRRDPTLWFGAETEKDAHTPRGTVIHTQVVADPDHYGGASCIFLLPDYRCGLQVAGEAAGLHPWRFKPYYCILHPLDLDERGRITLDEIRHMVDEPASCLRSGEKDVILQDLFAEELEYLSK